MLSLATNASKVLRRFPVGICFSSSSFESKPGSAETVRVEMAVGLPIGVGVTLVIAYYFLGPLLSSDAAYFLG